MIKNYIYNTFNNSIKINNSSDLLIRGVSRTGLEYLGLDLNIYTDDMIEFDISIMKTWHINAVRIPLRDAHWFENEDYKRIIDLFVNKLLNNDIIVILDLHTLNHNPKQDFFMIKNDMNDAKKFWIEVSNKYGNLSCIFFELFNEPNNIDANIWWYGNYIYYGYKEILIEVRKITNNICILGGLDFAYQFNFLKYNNQILNEIKNISNIVLAVHPYGYRGKPKQNTIDTEQIPINIIYPDDKHIGDCSTGVTIPAVSKDNYGWTESFGYLHINNIFPIVATEFGLDHTDTCIQGGWYPTDLLEYFDNHSIGYTAWAWVSDRLDYPSLLDKYLNPTGTASLYVYGPACGIIENNYYPGPGQLVYNNINKYNVVKRFMNVSQSVDKNHTLIIMNTINKINSCNADLLFIMCLILFFLAIGILSVVMLLLLKYCNYTNDNNFNYDNTASNFSKEKMNTINIKLRNRSLSRNNIL